MAYGFNDDKSKAPVYTKEEIDQMDLVNNQALQQEVADRQVAVSGEAGNRAASDAALSARIDNILIEQDLDPNKDSELVDIRTGYDGIVYSSAGEAVRNSDEKIYTKMAEKRRELNGIAKYVYTPANLYGNQKHDSGYIGVDGVLYESSTYWHTENIDVSNFVGETLYFAYSSNSTNARFLCAFDEYGNAIPDKGSTTSISSYTVPEGISSIVVSSSSDYRYFQICVGEVCRYDKSNSRYAVEDLQAIRNSILPPKPTVLFSQSLASGNSFDLESNSVKNGNQVFIGKCDIPAGGLNGFFVVGKSSYAFGVSDDKWAYYINGVKQGEGVEHGKTLKDYLLIIIKIQDEDGIADITFYTNGDSYHRTNTSWTGYSGYPCAKNDTAASLVNVSFTWSCEKIKKGLWIFGDSYLSIADNRWPYYLITHKFDNNILLNGYPGEEINDGLFDFIHLLQYGNPAMIINCLGMNNSDSSTGINATYLDYAKQFINVCKKNDIDIILATIPCTPVANNSFKNQWVRESGYRYIDFAKAVNVSQDSPIWFDGMLSSDNVHPTAQGAIALFSQAIIDVPELME